MPICVVWYVWPSMSLTVPVPMIVRESVLGVGQVIGTGWVGPRKQDVNNIVSDMMIVFIDSLSI